MIFLSLVAVVSLASDSGLPACGLQFYSSQATWVAATSSATLRVNFEEASWPVDQSLLGPWTVNGITFQGFAGAPQPNIFVADFGSPFGTGHWLTANGDEDIHITPAATTYAIAFDAASNALGTATVSVYAQGAGEIGSLLIPIGTTRFVGITSNLPIAYIRFSSTLGALQDTGLDNVRTASFDPDMSPDLNHDGNVDGADLGQLLSAWGPCPGGGICCPGDFNGDGNVDGADLGTLLAAWDS